MARSCGALCALVLCLAICGASGSLMAVDLGSEYLKVCLIKPGRTPIAIVVNEMSRRKSPALVGLAGEDRLLGEEAFSFAIRYPTTVFSRTRDFLGRGATDAYVQNLLKANALPYELVNHPQRKTVMARVNSTAAYMAEELVVRRARALLFVGDRVCARPCVPAGEADGDRGVASGCVASSCRAHCT